MVKLKHRLTVCCLMLWCLVGTAMAQSNPTYVITREGHFLAHQRSGDTYSLTDADTFDPTTCIWFSGPNIEHNYYFIDHNGNSRYLSAPLAPNGTLTLSDSHPGTVLLNKTAENYYFYDWDQGVARGVRLDPQECGAHPEYHGSSGGQCWQVVWLSYVDDQWKMSPRYDYDFIQDTAAVFQSVSITQYAAQVTPAATNPGGAPVIADFAMEFTSSPLATHQLNGTASAFSYSYVPAYTTYVIDGTTYYFDANGSSLTGAPGTTSVPGASPTSYAWTLTGEGAQYLQLSDTTIANPVLTYQSQNSTTSHKMATLTLTVTYGTGTSQVTETRTATVTVKTSCQNPGQAAAPVVTYENVTLSWLPSADSYKVEWTSDAIWDTLVEVGNVTSYTIPISQLKYAKTYQYRVVAKCGDNYQTPPTPSNSFTTLAQADVVILGAVYGGGRMADVDGSTEVQMINCDSVMAVYGGNDIAGTVTGSSNIILGTAASEKVRVFDVYGGGNGYYAYNGTSFTPASGGSTGYSSQTVAVDGTVNAMTPNGQVGNVVWTNEGTAPTTLNFPKIASTAIVMNTDVVKVDSIFGGAKNAFITTNNDNGSAITINGGTAYAVFGGNNIGGGQGYGKHHIEVHGTKTNTTTSEGLGRDFGIAYVFGGGNKVYGSTTEVFIYGGQCDTVFAGGNAASVYAANVTMNCVGSSNIITNAVSSWSGDNIDKINSNYPWNGTGVYNVRTLFGGNNRAPMDCLPTVNLTSGSAGTVYGGGNAGDMMAQTSGGSITFADSDFESYNFNYSTKVLMNSATMLVDNLYGGCQMSNVGYSTWVQVQNGHVGTVYGGCNISGDVGSERVNLNANPNNPDGQYQVVQGATYVEVSGGTVYKDVFAGSNGFYHCLDNFGIAYSNETGIVYDPLGRTYYGEKVPTHNETRVVISGSAIVNHNVYAGGNLAPVGFTTAYVHQTHSAFPYLVGLASVRMIGGEVKGDVYGGGRMASINGSNEVRVTAGTIDGALYGGNDRLGQAGQISNRKLPDTYNTASDNLTPLTSFDSHENVNTYVGVTGNPLINTVYGGGNGAYTYSGPGADMQYCDITDLPIQKNIFVDIAINGGGASGGAGYIENVYGGGNGVYTDGFVKVFLNVRDATASDGDHVGTIFGGNNMGTMDTIPDIILLHGNVHTVYGGCNSGAMTGVRSYTGDDGTTYNNIGSLVHLRDRYTAGGTTVIPDAKVTGAVYGGCRMNSVTNNSLVLVEGGNHSTASMFGGCDISGTVGGTSQVVVKNGTNTSPNNSTVIGNAFGGGNGDYNYETGTYAGLTPPSSTNSRVDMMSGTANNLYGGGNACGSGATLVNVNNGTVNTGVYGGSNAKGTITGDVEVNILGGTIGASTSARANIHGGGYGALTETRQDVTVNIGATDGLTPPTYSGTAVINGDIYGGSALGQVSASNKLTQVNFYKGTINGDVYGGGLGNNDHAAEISGNVEVNILGGVFNGATGAAGGGNIYGCNNANGSPKGDVYVNIYATENNYYPTTTIATVEQLATNAATQAYAINAVFGGGNLAAYKPTAVGEGETPHSTTVHVYNCNNTISDVFGGGNAADVGIGTVGGTITQRNDTYVIIEGGRIHRVIGGGNGEDLSKPAANIFGTANTIVYAGLIDEVYGGANRQGDIDVINLTMSNPGNSSLNSTSLAGCTDQVYGKVFGCANAADYNRSVTTNILCGVGEIGELYGGSNLANIGTEGQFNADVTLNLYGGIHTQVFAGSKGDLASLPGTGHTNKASNIYGNVTLNLFGGKVTNAFGGSNYNGNIAGTITVNVLDKEDSSCAAAEALDLTNVYGASNLADYTPTFTPASGTDKVSPVVNVIHIAQTPGISGNVYGGGNRASVSASPQVNIGYDAATMASILTACGYTQPSGFPRGYVSGNVFGGGNEAGVTGNPVINMRDNGTVVTGIYGGCHQQGNVDGDINVNIYGGTLGTSTSAMMTDGIFGGGKGSATQTTGNVTVTIGDGTTPSVYADVYGGSAFGEVGSSNKLAKVNLKNGTVYGNMFGGGKGDNNTAAVVTGSSQVAVEGGTALLDIFGGCNVNGIVKETSGISITGGTLGAAETGTSGDPGYAPEVRVNAYGGGLGQNTKVKGDIDVSVNGSTANVYGDVYGGSAKGLVNCNETGTGANSGSKTEVALAAGTIHGNLYGGGHGIANTNAHVYGPVTVTVSGGTANSVFGGNNLNGAPQNTVAVNMTNGTVNNLMGGGDQAAYAGTPVVTISGGSVLERVIGGGNAADVGGTNVNITGGTFGLGTGEGRGVFGGCNASGTVNGDVLVDVTGGTFGNQTIINNDVTVEKVSVNIHGGGYGQSTATTGNVTVNYGADSNTHSIYPKLYGDLYGGSALGSVNDADSDETTVNVRNGSFGYAYETITVMVNGEPENIEIQYGGNVYGGGLGRKADNTVSPAVTAVEATVNGTVYVNVGAKTATGYSGLADLEHCSVYGGNNQNGSPQSDVYVKVYQTYHTDANLATASGFAIGSVYGGGNEANYDPAGTTTPPVVDGSGHIITPGTGPRTHVYIYSCENTIQYTYGGGNAAHAVGTVVVVEGGHFGDIFGGGNGLLVVANIGAGGVGMDILGGRVNYWYEGSNLNGNNLSNVNYIADATGFTACDGGLVVETYFFGANEAVTYGDLIKTIECAEASHYNYTNVFAGSRFATIYGDVRLTVRGGTIVNLFGGSQGYPTKPAHIRRFPTQDEITNGNYIHGSVPQAMIDHLTAHPEDYGKGGNVVLTVEGGTIGNIYGGNQVKGDIDGIIMVIVDSKQLECPLSIENIYAASDRADYAPYDVTDAGGTHKPYSPLVYLKNGTVSNNVLGGGFQGNVTGNPVVVIGNGASGTTDEAKAGNVFGGGYEGNVTGNTNVILQGKATINQNVYGGGYLGDVDGETQVTLTPAKHTLTITQPQQGGTITVNSLSSSSISVGDNTSLPVVATPAAGYVFTGWTVTGTGASVSNASTEISIFNMGTGDATITATFTQQSKSRNK